MLKNYIITFEHYKGELLNLWICKGTLAHSYLPTSIPEELE